MECPHCQQEIATQSCESCGQLILPGAKFCHHCGQELGAPAEEPKLLTCESCGHKLLPGAAFCHDCGKALPPGQEEEPKLLTCESCGRTTDAEDHYCPSCGEPIGEGGHSHGEAADSAGFDPEERMACPDGMCIGIIGPDGRCTECGKRHGEIAREEGE